MTTVPFTRLASSGLPRNPASGRTRTRSAGSLKLLAGGTIVAALLVASVAVPAVTGTDPTAQVLADRLLPPSGAHLFGTDDLGRDVLIRCLAAARLDIPLALLGALIPTVIGCVLGLLAGYAGRFTDTVVMRSGDILQSLPSYVFLIVVAYLVGPWVGAFLVAAAVLSWVNYARIIRSQVLVLRELDFTHAARLSGLGSMRVAARHVLPNALPQVVVYFASDSVLSLTTLSGLSFLGLGIAPPTAEWGLMVLDGKSYLATAWWMALFPGLLIGLTGAAFALLSDGLDERRRR